MNDDLTTRRNRLLNPNASSGVEVAEYMIGCRRRRLTAGRTRELSITFAVNRVFRLRRLYMNTPHEGLLFLRSYTVIAGPTVDPVIRYGRANFLGAPTPFVSPTDEPLWEPKDKWFDTVNFAPSAAYLPLDIVTFVAGGSLRLDLYYTGKARRGARGRPWTLAASLDGFTTVSLDEERANGE